MSTATTTININALGIQDMEKHISTGEITVYAALQVLDSRIAKRLANKQSLLRPVVEYRNKLAEAYELATGDKQPVVPVPTYAKVPTSSLPTDPEKLADVVFATVGAANVGQVIARLTARVVGI